MDDVWGLSEPPARSAEHPPPLPPWLAGLAALDRPRELADPGSWRTPSAEELPEVAALAGDRWRPLEPAPLYCLLPAVWPAEHRCWVPDRLPKVVLQQRQDGTLWMLPAAQHPDESAGRLEAAEAVAAGLVPPPAGRIWLLRSPWPWLGLSVVLSLIWRRAQQSGPASLPHDLVPAARGLFGFTEPQLRAWWTGEDALAAAAWEAAGRVGEDVAALVERGLGPAEVGSLVTGAGLTEARIVSWCDSIGGRGPAAVERIQLWRAFGVPADPPDYLYHFDDFSAAELRAWLEAGFDHAQMLSLQGVSLARAVLWREAGYSAAETAELLEADERLTPAEAAEHLPPGNRENDR